MQSRKSPKSKFIAENSGATAVEFAMVTPVFLLLLFGLFQFTYLIFMGSSVQWATDKAARLAIIDSEVSVEAIEAKILSYITTGNPEITVSLTTTTLDTLEVLHVTTVYNHHVEGPLVPSFSIPFSFETVVPKPQ